MKKETFDINSVSGAQEITSWFGNWPSFHDAEVLEIFLSREEESKVKIDVWEYGSDLDENGNFEIRKRAVVCFFLSDVTELLLTNFNEQNVISELVVEESAENFSLVFKPCYGLSGKISAKSLRVEFEPNSTG